MECYIHVCIKVYIDSTLNQVQLFLKHKLGFLFQISICTHLYTAGNLLIHSIMFCSLNVEENFLFWLRRLKDIASGGRCVTIYVWISFTSNYANLRICQFHIGMIYLSYHTILQQEWLEIKQSSVFPFAQPHRKKSKNRSIMGNLGLNGYIRSHVYSSKLKSPSIYM